MAIRSPIPTGLRAWHRVTVQNPAPAQAIDGDVVMTPWTDAVPPDWYVAMDVLTGIDQERAKRDGVLTQPSVTVTGPYRSDVTTASRLVDGARVLYVVGVDDPGRRRFELVVQCSEVAAT